MHPSFSSANVELTLTIHDRTQVGLGQPRSRASRTTLEKRANALKPIDEKDSRPRIGLDLLFLLPNRIGGAETYARGLIQGLRDLDPPFDFIVFLNREAYPTFAELDEVPFFERVLCPVPLDPSIRHVWQQAQYPSICRRHKIDLLHCLGNVIPFRAPCRTTVTIHDMLYKREPQCVPFLRREVLGRLISRSAARTDLVITVSHASENDIEHYLHVPQEKIHVTPEGPGQLLTSASPWEQVRDKYQVVQPYFLTVGSAPHKRLDRIAAALEILRSEKRMNVNLISTSVDSSPSEGTIRQFGFVPPEDLATLYKHAIALICFSDLEGFGLTALEAMGLGTPVVASDAASLPEVLGDGGIIVEHGDSRALANAMWRIATDQELHSEMRNRGLKRVANFSWIGCAAETARAYAKVLSRE